VPIIARKKQPDAPVKGDKTVLSRDDAVVKSKPIPKDEDPTDDELPADENPLAGRVKNRVDLEPTLDLKRPGVSEAVLNLSQRQKRAQIMRRTEAKLERGKERLEHRPASEDQVRKRALAKARDVVRRKFAGARGQDYSNLSQSDKIAVDKMIADKAPVVKKIAIRMIPRVRRDDLQRLRKNAVHTPGQTREGVEDGVPDGEPEHPTRRKKRVDDAAVTAATSSSPDKGAMAPVGGTRADADDHALRVAQKQRHFGD
jgi:hypothetical protein